MKMTVQEKMQEEQEKYLRNIREMDELACRKKRVSGFPCSKESCSKFGTPRCIYLEKAGFPGNRY